MHKLSVITPGSISRSFDLQPGVNRIGRNPLNDLVFSDPAISGFHCEIEVTNQGVYVRDLGSTNGTFINRQPIKEAPFAPGQFMRLGQVDMVLDAPPVTIAIPELPMPEPERQRFLPDGARACQTHPAIRATLKCTNCERTYCIDCVKLLGRAGGRKLRFCPVCSGPCEPFAPLQTTGRQQSSLFARMAKTIRERL
jgi:hypothetical protein